MKWTTRMVIVRKRTIVMTAYETPMKFCHLARMRDARRMRSCQASRERRVRRERRPFRGGHEGIDLWLSLKP